jgi:hypothetical protein
MPTTPHLFGEALRAACAPWLDELGKSDRERLEGLLGLAVNEQFRLSDCLAALFPGMEPRKAQAALTSFRKRLNDAATGEGRADLGLRSRWTRRSRTLRLSATAGSRGPTPR